MSRPASTPIPYAPSSLMNGPTFVRKALLPLMALGCLATALPSPAQSTPEGANPTAQRFRSLLIEINELNNQKRYADALERLADAEALNQDEALVENVRGSIMTSLREFEKARASFEKARQLKPGAFEPRFNLSELDFVEGRYDKAEASFTALLKDFPKLPLQPRHLALFKIHVSQLKQGRLEAAATTAKAFTSMDDTPAHYFAQVATASQKNRPEEAQQWLESAQRIFKPYDLVPYLDTLMEAKWINSIVIPEKK